MRTTVTIDPDVESLLRRAIRERGLPFKQVLNAAIRDGLSKRNSQKPGRFKMKTHRMGVARGVDLTRALQLAAEMEDEEIMRKMRAGK